MQRIVWITGLSGAGKTTLGKMVVNQLRDNGKAVIFLDGDQLREIFNVSSSIQQNYDRESRLSLAMQYSNLCHVIAGQNITIVISTISMFKEVHIWNRENLPNYFEVFLKVPINELKRRDSKYIYHRYASGELSHVAGLDLKVDEPLSPDLLFDFNDGYTVEKMTQIIINNIE
jgi:adenylylsulfate kinase